MRQHLRTTFVQSIALVTVFVVSAVARADSETASLANQMPSGAIAFGEISGLDDVLGRLQNSTYWDTLTGTTQYQQVEKSPQYRKAQAARQIAETQLGMDLWTAGKRLLGGRIGVALYPRPNSKQPDAVVLVRVADKAAMAQFRERLQPLLVLAEDQIDQSETIERMRVINLDDKAFLSMNEEWVVASNRRELFKQTLQGLQQEENPDCLAHDKEFQAMTRQMGSDHFLRTYVNTNAISKSAGGRFVPEKLGNPLASLLFGGIVELAVHSPYAGVTLDIKDDHFLLTAAIAGGPKSLGDKHQVFFSDPETAGTPAIPRPKQVLGGISIHRDFAEWYQRREELMKEDVLPGFDKFEAGLGNLLPNRDFGQDVLPLLGKSLTFVSAPQGYDHLDGKPGVQLPGFALIIELAKPKEAGDVIQLFFQTLASIVNIQAGQQKRQPWVMTSETYNDVQISFGRYLQKPKGQRLPIVFNFLPAAARVDNQYIISSSLGLCRQLIDQLKAPATAAKQPNRNFNFELYFDSVAEMLQANRQFFQARAIQQGRTAQQAGADFDTVVRLLKTFKSLQLSTSAKADAFQAQLQGVWK